MEIIIVCRAVWKYRFLPQAFSCSVFPGKETYGSLPSLLMRASFIPGLGLRSHTPMGTVAGCKHSFHLNYAFFHMFEFHFLQGLPLIH